MAYNFNQEVRQDGGLTFTETEIYQSFQTGWWIVEIGASRGEQGSRLRNSVKTHTKEFPDSKTLFRFEKEARKYLKGWFDAR